MNHSSPAEARGSGALALPSEPMGPIARDDIPEGPDWGYQLKWDGVRALARVDRGDVELFSRKLLRKNDTYPEVVRRLQRLEGSYLLDGEIVYFDAARGRPVFQKVLQRERTRTASALARSSAEAPVSYVLFDLLAIDGEDLRDRPYAERYARLREAFPPDGDPALFVTDLFRDGPALWQWVEERGWEGIVSKRLSAPYAEGKRHKDSYKKRTIQRYDAVCVGVTFREGRVASLALLYEGVYLGRASLGLNERSRAALAAYASAHRAAASPFPGGTAPAELKRETVVWLDRPFPVAVTGLEITADGLLRHPKLAEPAALEQFLTAAITAGRN
ncbi:DNA ligase [Paenibacillus sp.]|uniref:ATP-dependent DNA ligase n=1 Tax=Paenibacillus sp. TaxID=58172 RepID=UPI002D56C22E|nr:DNA ligase [Paenibacillus sp.]HZG86109.1 DNA ligase [Paenibacillus sp.]